jgi:hypothetical protein
MNDKSVDMWEEKLMTHVNSSDANNDICRALSHFPVDI